MSGTEPLLDVWVPGVPRPQPRPRAFHKNGMTRMYTPKGPITQWRETLSRTIVPGVESIDGSIVDIPVKTILSFSVERVATARPDLDNLIKPVFDVLNELQFWADDSLVVDLHATKVKDKENPGVRIQVYPA